MRFLIGNRPKQQIFFGAPFLNQNIFLPSCKSKYGLANIAIKQLTEIIESEKESRKVYLIGSSLGGYYAVYLAESLDLKAAMVNPAVWAYKIFENDRGENLNPNTNEKYIIDQKWVDSLEEIFIETPDTKRYLVLLQTADETLDYRYAEKYFSGAKTIIDQGGSHSFEDLESKIPEMLAHFC